MSRPAAALDRRRYPQTGRSVDVGGHTLNIYCSGKGGPTVVFDTFSHMAGFVWSRVQPEVTRFTRACWYDRAGYGWSEPARFSPTFRWDAAALHTLLSVAGETRPYVFVGPGDAALRLRVYRAAYPQDVAGIVMINPIGVDENRIDVPDEAKGFWAKHFGPWAPRVRGAACKIAPAFSAIGIVRLASLFGHPRRTPSLDFPPEDRNELDFLSDNPTTGTNMEVCFREENMEQARAAGDLANLPLIVLATRPQPKPAVSAWENNRMKHVLPEAAHLSSRGRLGLVEGSVSEANIVEAVYSVMGLATKGSQ